MIGHSPHGECGLKCIVEYRLLRSWKSLPAWGVRVEILRSRVARAVSEGHSPHGECGLK